MDSATQPFPGSRVIGTDDDDSRLVERCLEGDRDALAELVVRYQRPIYHLAYRMLGNVEDAQEITQGVFLKVAERLDEYDPGHKFFSWIYRITINASLNLLRRNGHEELRGEDPDVADDRLDPEASLNAAQQSARVQKALLGLKMENRAVLTLRHFAECSYREISQILEVDEKTVKSRLYEGRQQLRTLLKDLEDQ
ncbi:MAG TPA: sigma-70 family RNA polymerase sigma factor [Burkholderiales bacterium]|jgi:RNA polymerase sigma-70 factor (ECF subfamily)|nr:sigma-70 family RNA polymerase sigma factor [Burkholderiales bacterium]